MVGPFFMFLVIFYSYYQMFSDERGVVAWYDLKQQVAALEQDNAGLMAEVERTEDHLSRLKKGNLDADFLDEQIRRNLPKMHPNETVIFLK